MTKVSVTPIREGFGAELSGFGPARPLDPSVRDDILAAMDRYGVCVFRDTGLDDASHIAFTRALGEIYVQPPVGTRRRLLHPELFDAGNLGPDGEVVNDENALIGQRGNWQWHTDHSFMPRRAAYSLLLAYEVPQPGGDTEFADMRGAYDALPADTKTLIEDLVAEHSIWYSRMTGGMAITEEEIRDRQPIAHHRLVQTHAGSGRKTLYLAAHIRAFAGWPDDEARKLVRELMEFATQPRFTFAHRWRVGDLVMWDDRCTMHRGRPYDDLSLRRDLRRTNVLDAA